MNNPDNIVVSARDVTKKYRIFTSPKDRVKEALHPLRKRYHHDFWALKGVSFDIRKGQVIGILGQNGSGKSTLLQIIASVLTPTSGTLNVNGRVSALLELGTGFNPEFTGRQNVLLNGALMGVSHEEMLRRMPAITAFADIGEFFDQPMKTYSSGMFVRVAFAASIHVDADILIIDEALAVGDAKFQHKCFQRLRDLQSQQKTIIFVTHNSSLVTSYCDHAFLLDNGNLVVTGEPAYVVDRYYELSTETTAHSLLASIPGNVTKVIGEWQRGLKHLLDESKTIDICHIRRNYNQNEVRFGDGAAHIVDYVLESDGIWDVTNIRFGSTIAIYIKVLFRIDIARPMVGFSVRTLEGLQVYGTNTFLMARKIMPVIEGQVCIFKFSFQLFVNPSDYFFDLGVAEVDGTRAGAILEVRRSIAHCFISLQNERSFDGVFDLKPTFEVIAENIQEAGLG